MRQRERGRQEGRKGKEGGRKEEREGGKKARGKREGEESCRKRNKLPVYPSFLTYKNGVMTSVLLIP